MGKPSEQADGAWALGIDLGGTKITGAVLDAGGRELVRLRIATPRGDYTATLGAVAGLVEALEARLGRRFDALGVGIPGSVSKRSGRVQNANSTWLNGRCLGPDLEGQLARRIVLANDANCFALSEATDGAAAGVATVFGVILGTGTGGGIVRLGRIVDGPLGIGGEWGHNPLPWPQHDEYPGPACWCGRKGCMEVWVSGPGLAADHASRHGGAATPEEIAAAAAAGERAAQSSLARHADRLARGLAHVINILDPDVIVLGGGLSKLPHLYTDLPGLIQPHVFADDPAIDIRTPRWGDDGGVRGAAWLVRVAPSNTGRPTAA